MTKNQLRRAKTEYDGMRTVSGNSSDDPLRWRVVVRVRVGQVAGVMRRPDHDVLYVPVGVDRRRGEGRNDEGREDGKHVAAM